MTKITGWFKEQCATRPLDVMSAVLIAIGIGPTGLTIAIMTEAYLHG